ncbi:MAG: hypothetical protein WCX64_02900 [Candidatus Micrarchaeia archaeon]|jgi:hypothetical protein
MAQTGLLFPIVFLVALFAPLASAAYVQITAPVAATAYDGTVIDFGTVGPGQSLEISASEPTGEPAYGNPSVIAVWDQLNFVPDSIPKGWTYENGKTYERNFHAFLIVSPQAADGDYTFRMMPVDEYEGVASITLTGKVRVSRGVFGLTASPSQETVAVGTPALYTLTLENKAMATDTYNVTVSGFPGAAKYSKKVTVIRQSKAATPFEVVSNEQATHQVTFTAVSLSSSRINASATASVTSKASLFEDVQSAGYGLLLFSNSQQAVVGFLAFAANAYDALMAK